MLGALLPCSRLAHDNALLEVEKLAEDMAGCDVAKAGVRSEDRFGYLENSAELHKENGRRAYQRMESTR